MSAAESAILRLAQARAVVAGLSRKIGKALQACSDQQCAKDPECVSVNHLKAAYAITREKGGEGYPAEVYFDNHDGDAGAYLAEICPYCHAAHEAIQERKLARKQHGIAKRRISVMGSTMLKQVKKQGETA